jgi:hypothetical protein
MNRSEMAILSENFFQALERGRDAAPTVSDRLSFAQISVHSRLKMSGGLRRDVSCGMILSGFSGEQYGNDQGNHDAPEHPEV